MFEPAAVSNLPNMITLFVTNTNDQISTRWWSESTSWSPWANWNADEMGKKTGGVLTVSSGPAAVSKAVGQLDVFVRGTDNELWTRWFNEREGWSKWDSLGGDCKSGPAAATRHGQLHVFVQNAHGGLSIRSWNEGSNWSAWDNLPNGRQDRPDVDVPWFDTPAALCPTEDVITVYVLGADQTLWQRNYTEARGGFNRWEPQDKFDETPQVTSAPAVAARGGGKLDLFAKGLADDLRTRSFIGGPPDPWTAWNSLGGICTSGPAAISKAEGQLDVFVRNTNGGLSTKWFNETQGWGEWGDLGGELRA